MSGLTINGKAWEQATIRPLAQDYQGSAGVERAIRQTQGNRLDEVFFQQDGRAYVAYGTGLDAPKAKRGEIPAVSLQGRPVTVLHVANEANTVGERARQGAGKGAKYLAIGGAIAGGLATLGYQRVMTYATPRGTALTVLGAAALAAAAAGAVGAVTGAGAGAIPWRRPDHASIQAVTGQTP